MRCPLLYDLPSPPAGRTGWPWVIDPPQLPNVMPNGKPWPKISIVTPSLNQGIYIEETIRSVLLQGYPDLEYVIIDGGSTDQSVDIIKKYENWLKFWISEPDKGQSDAVMKGLKYTEGEWVNWLNSDDILNPNALKNLALLASSVSSKKIALTFSCDIVSEDGRNVIETWYARCPENAVNFFEITKCPPVIPQPSTFIRKEHLVLEDMQHYVMDWSLYIRLIDQYENCFEAGACIIARFRMQPEAKTSIASEKFSKEAIDFVKKYKFISTSAQYSANNWICRSLAHELIGKWMISGGFFEILPLLARFPFLLKRRFFWGALRRKLFNLG